MESQFANQNRRDRGKTTGSLITLFPGAVVRPEAMEDLAKLTLRQI